MKTKHVFFYRLFAIFMMVGVVFSMFNSAYAQDTTPETPTTEASSDSDRPLPMLPTVSADKPNEITIEYHSGTGMARYLAPALAGRALAQPFALNDSVSPEESARSFMSEYGKLFGLKDQSQELTVMRAEDRDGQRSHIRFQQTYQGIPVLGGELIVNIDAAKNVLSVSGEILPDIKLDVSPAIDGAEAQQIALVATSKEHGVDVASLTASEPELWVYNPVLVEPWKGPTVLAWRFDVTPVELAPIRQMVLVEASRGAVVLSYNQTDTAKYRATYNANNGISLPGALICTESNPTCAGGDAHAIAAHKYAGHSYDFYFNHHNRDSINNAGMALISTVHFYTNYCNAFWNGSQMVYGDGCNLVVDDVVAHEVTHGVTNYEANLFYFYQSGAINESFSDIWGEFVDLTNGDGNDSTGVRWLMGEDASVGAMRSMSNPPAYSDPDKMTSIYYYTSSGDNGGVHYNSGVGNKAAYLMTDGGTFNGQTVSALGITKVAKIFYEVNSNLLTSGSDYADLYNALYQGCRNLIGTSGITTANCEEVRKATLAVEMHMEPYVGFNPEAVVCAGPKGPADSFSDSFEGGFDKWIFGAVSGASAWTTDDPWGPNTHSGVRVLYGDDGWLNSNSFARIAFPIYIPPYAYMHFYHYFDLESGFDGGVVEYSTNGVTWFDASSMIDSGKNYTGSVSALGRTGYTGFSRGYVSTRLNLGSLAGQSVYFRWRMATDSSVVRWGWWVDDVRIYTCSAWSGGASIISSKPVVAVARPHVGAEVASYNGFSSGSLTSYVPMLFKKAFGGTYNSALYVQNLSSSTTADVSVKYYTSSGTPTCTVNDTISPLSSKGYWLPTVSCLPEGWVGGAVVTSSQNIVTVGRPHVGSEVMTYDGFASGNTTSYLPMLFKKAFGGTYNAAFYIQNVHSSSSATVTIEYYNVAGVLNCTVTDTVAPLASKGYWLPSVGCLSDGWVGGAVVTSIQPIVTVARPHVGSQVTTYNGFTAGSADSYVPMLFKNAYSGGSYKAAFYVQNVQLSKPANITIWYYDSVGALNCTVSDTISPFASKGYWLPSVGCLSDGWVGGAIITSDVDIVAVGRPHIGAQVTTYPGFSAGSANVYLPMLFKDAFGGSYDSAVYIQNTHASTSAIVTVNFYDTNGVLSCTKVDTIQPRATLGYWLPSICNP